jgi:hypothetical protein
MERRAVMFGRAALEMAGFRPKILKKSLKRYEEALDAVAPARRVTTTKQTPEATEISVTEIEGGAPDHTTRIKAADRLFKMADVLPRGRANEAPREPFTVEVVTYGSDGKPMAVKVSGSTRSNQGS